MLTVLTNKPERVTENCKVVSSDCELQGGDVLIVCCTSLILKPEILAKYGLAMNIHPGPKLYPGRDPHHWAIYERAKEYGVTLHIMSERVDEGRILQTESFLITQSTPEELRKAADDRAFLMLNNVIRKIDDGSFSISESPHEWSGVKRKRKDLIEMCRFKGLTLDEINHRKYAFQGFEKFFRFE